MLCNTIQFYKIIKATTAASATSAALATTSASAAPTFVAKEGCNRPYHDLGDRSHDLDGWQERPPAANLATDGCDLFGRRPLPPIATTSAAAASAAAGYNLGSRRPQPRPARCGLREHDLGGRNLRLCGRGLGRQRPRVQSWPRPSLPASSPYSCRRIKNS